MRCVPFLFVMNKFQLKSVSPVEAVFRYCSSIAILRSFL